ncbi:hypothetical protein VQ02_07355 [Methylobacterium variabile]|uniref:Uncharacterized protein n=1 Tax=Methylobacterium variabile TaxID=298794 RepID=A0A0J6T3Z0_9HYPH|nr:hypothetical protein [Methylobacterium variabile]KMO40649.1 hypothetical protein VQ02_07355 [Methylobacterium variabile]
MKREERVYDLPPERQPGFKPPPGEDDTPHWHGIYNLPRRVRRALRRPLSILFLTRRTQLLQAVNALLLTIGRFHTAPSVFDVRGCGLEGGFLLDRRGLTGPNAPPTMQHISEWLCREAIRFLLNVGLIERITPKALTAVEDRNGRFGFWLKAVRHKDGIRAPAVRYKLGPLLRSLFAETLRRPVPGAPEKEVTTRPPVGVSSDQDKNQGKNTLSGVSMGEPLPHRQVGELVRSPEPEDPSIPTGVTAAAYLARRGVFEQRTEEDYLRAKREVQEELARKAARRMASGGGLFDI